MVVTVIGDMAFDLVTATEPAALGALIALLVSWAMLGRGNGARSTPVYKRDTVLGTVTSTARLFILLIGAAIITRVLTLAKTCEYTTGDRSVDVPARHPGHHRVRTRR